MIKPVLKFKKMREANFLRYANNVVARMEENVSLFPDCEPPLSVLKGTLHRLSRAMAEAQFRDMRCVAIKNQLLRIHKEQLYRLSLYIAQVAQGDPWLILSAGFATNKPYATIGAAPKPHNLRVQVQMQRPGCVRCRVEVWKKATGCRFEYRKVGDALWNILFTTKSSCEINGLQSLEQHEFRVAYTSSNPTITYSSVVRSYVV